MSLAKIALLGIGMVIGFFSGTWKGFEKGRYFETLSEVKVVRAMLLNTKDRVNVGPISREFLIARYYVNLAKLSEKDRDGLVLDFGIVDKSLLEGILIDKNVSDPSEAYGRIIPARK